jgi:Cytochrome P450
LGDKELTWSSWNSAFQCLTRRVLFGNKAADDTALTAQLSELMSAGNKMPGAPAPGYSEFISHIGTYLANPEPNSLAALIAETPCPAESNPAGQVVHWMFAMGDTLAANAFRTLAVLSIHSEQRHEVVVEAANADIATAAGVASLKYLGGCLLDTMRLWPTTMLFGRVAARDVEFPSGAVLPAGKQVLIYNVFNHRNRDRIPYADRFSPGEWVSGDAGDDWSYNFFSHSPQGCPGAGLSVFLGQAVLARLLQNATPVLRGANLDPANHCLTASTCTASPSTADPASAVDSREQAPTCGIHTVNKGNTGVASWARVCLREGCPWMRWRSDATG